MMMQSEPVDWLPPLAVLAVGMVVGLFLVLRARNRAAGDLVTTPIVIADAERRFDALIARLRELAVDASQRERLTLELEAAQALRELEQLRAEQAAPVETAADGEARKDAASSQPKSALAPVMWFTGAATAAATVYVLLTLFMAPRPEGGAVTGGEGMNAASAVPPQQTDADLLQLQQAVAAQPDNLELRNDLAKVYIARQDWMSTWNETKFVLDRQPDNSRALAYQALVRLAMGDNATAEAMLKQSLAKDPDLLDAWIHLSLVYFEAGRTSDALAALKEARTRHPQEAAGLQQLEQEILRSPVQPAAPAAGATAAASPAASGPVIRAEVSLAPGIAGSVRLPALMFVTVRSAGVAAGPPAAAKRMQVTSFPVRLELSAADSMMGTPLPDVARVEVRIDLDGDAMTREPNAPTAVADQVRSGADLKLQLAVK